MFGGSGRGGGLGESLVDLASIFEPANRHLAAERRRQKANRRQAGQGAPPFDLELDTGTGRFSGTYRVAATGDPAVSPPPQPEQPATAD
jgi:Family of unknown function (DUF6191)